MEKAPNKYIAVAYKLYTVADGASDFIEEAPASKPFVFISGMGITLPAFEQAIFPLEQDGAFDFVLDEKDAYGEYVPSRVIDLDREIFCINGKFDGQHIVKDAIIPLQNEDGNRFMGRVLEVGDQKVKVDLNHPLAGKQLHFVGHVVESREATNEEIQQMINQLNGEGGCGSCGGDCGGGCGGCHSEEGDCCGHCGK